jgi:DNA-binding MarR family transcriptional regulator
MAGKAMAKAGANAGAKARATAPEPPVASTRAAAKPALPMDDSIFFKLVRIVNLTARPFAESIGRANRLSLTEWRVMIVLASHPGIAAQEVALHTGLDKMSVSRALAGLARYGRIVRRDDPADKRRVRLTLSAAGERVYERIGVSGKAREVALFSPIGAAEQARFGRTLDKLIACRLAADSG